MDTTWRDAHQSLLATRVRTRDILDIGEGRARTHQLFPVRVCVVGQFPALQRAGLARGSAPIVS